ncbi:MAG: glycosyltransferase family 2 protein [Methylacidiphilales bacterium]|nr:glycosyltransferase family 2 protein [Candidatus Methylacidiphilales bacterium]
MRISVIIPSYQTAAYLEETLLSVLEQKYPDLELLVIDGGSTDGSIDILRKYEKHLAFWVSEPDRGQTHAINKGLQKMTGDAWMYLNSDDILLPGFLQTVEHYFKDPSIVWISGTADTFASNGVCGEIVPVPARTASEYLRPWGRSHSYLFPFSDACFMRRSVYEKLGRLG